LSLPVPDSAVLKKILAIASSAPSTVYAPSDDSFLMIDAIARLQLIGRKVLDMGTGSGILGLYCAMCGAEVTASDIDEVAVQEVTRTAEALGVQMKTCVSDLFSDIHDRFDLILFNPPYMPSARVEDRSIDGGSGGIVITSRFIEGLPSHLNRRAETLLLLSSMNDPSSIQFRHSNLEFSTVARKSLFFEELEVLRVRLRNDFTI
jgi:release factor glutamine methyltransferase